MQERGAESIPPIVPVRGSVEVVRKFMQGDYYIGRGSRERNLKPSVFGNPFKVWQYTDELGPYDVTQTCCARTTFC